MKSMTGYGKGSFEIDGLRVSIEIKAVNHRFLDLNLKVPKALGFAEDTVRKMIKSSVARGHLDVYVSYEDARQNKTELDINFELAKKYCDASEFIAKKLSYQNDFSIMALFKLPDIVSEKVAEADEKLLMQLVENALMSAINSLAVMRATEGEMLIADLLTKIGAMRKEVDFVKERMPKIVEEYSAKLRARVAELLGDTQVDEAKLLNEVAFMADRVCMDEELLRLTSHFDHFEKLIIQSMPNGRQLDFIVQEMNRETNTIGSKCNDISVTEKVLWLKNEIEKIREQVQNLE